MYAIHRARCHRCRAHLDIVEEWNLLQIGLHVKSRRREDVTALQIRQTLTNENPSTVADSYAIDHCSSKGIRYAMKTMNHNAGENILYMCRSCSTGWSRDSGVANDVTRRSGDRVFSPWSMARSIEISELDLGIMQEAGVKPQRINAFTCLEGTKID